MRDLLRTLEDLNAREWVMFELDPSKDQIMTVCKIALANLVMWTRDLYFPPSYAHATWQRMVPFFQLAGWMVREAETVRVELRPFNDRPLNRDLAAVCARVNELQPRLPDGRYLMFTVSSQACRISPAKVR